MGADASFVIGDGHRVCEDYAVAGIGARGPYAVVSDGCSSSPDTDFGARLLAAAAAHDLRRGELSPERALTAAAAAVAAVGLPATALDATLLCAHVDADLIHIAVTGDGVVATRDHRGTVEAWAIRHPTGAPAYLSYRLDDDRMRAYLAEHATREVDELFSGYRYHTAVSSLTQGPYVWRLTLPVCRYAVVALCSDGVSSFRSDSGAVAVGEVLAELLDFKVMRGAFVSRRLRKFLRRDCPQRGWRHDDDLAMAAIHLEHSP